MILFLVILSIFLGLLLTASLYYMIKFLRIIMILEDDFSESIESLEKVENSIGKILSMQLFFDSKEVKVAVQETLMEVKICRMTVNNLIQKFTERSKQKYIRDDEESTREDFEEKLLLEKLRKYNELDYGINANLMMNNTRKR